MNSSATRGDGFAGFVVEQMAVAGRPRLRRMFGGHGIYLDDVFVAIIADERLYLKADEQTRQRFEAQGLRAFTYARNGKPFSLGYYEAPAEVFESPAEMAQWARLAISAALRAQSRKPAPGESLASRGKDTRRTPR